MGGYGQVNRLIIIGKEYIVGITIIGHFSKEFEIRPGSVCFLTEKFSYKFADCQPG
jgi:hypothetical protein